MTEQHLSALYEAWAQTVEYEERSLGADNTFWIGAGSFLEFLIDRLEKHGTNPFREPADSTGAKGPDHGGYTSAGAFGGCS